MARKDIDGRVCRHCGSDDTYRYENICRGCRSAAATKWRKDNHDQYTETRRRRELMKKHGMTLETYDAMLDEQGGVCAICGGDHGNHSRGSDRLVVDHNHDTGEVRGLLCHPCNLVLARLTSADLLDRAANYLRGNA